MVQKIDMQPVSRRDLLKFTGAGAAAVVGATLLPGLARADAKAVSEEIMKRIGDKKTVDGRITLELPQIAENGNTVPMGVEVESPMTDADHVKTVHIFADKNPAPNVASFHFTPASGLAKANTRIRLRGTQNIVAVAEMSDGSVYMSKAAVKVTIGGCGG